MIVPSVIFDRNSLSYLSLDFYMRTGIPRFTLLMWGHKNKTHKSRLLSSTKGEENRIEL